VIERSERCGAGTEVLSCQAAVTRLRPAGRPHHVKVREWNAGYPRYQIVPSDSDAPLFWLEVGPLFDGSGQRERYPDTLIRSCPEAARIAEQIADAINAAGGIRL
jgi:hypothetical protein